MSLTIIGFGSRARVGKDTAYQIIKEQYPHAQRMAFADPLKARLRPIIEALGVDPDTNDSRLKAALRPLLVGHGVTGRLLHPDYWVNTWAASLPESGLVVVTDVRYENEAKAIQDRGGYVIEIDRPGTGYANEEEAKHSPQVRRIADQTIQNWSRPEFEHEVLNAVTQIIHPLEYSYGPVS